MNMVRSIIWERALSQYLEHSKNCKFMYGGFDCCTFAAGAIEVMTGVDVMASLHDYDSALSAYRLIAKSGGLELMLAEVMKHHGCKEIYLLHASRGDIVLGTNEEDRDFVGVVGLDGWQCWAPAPTSGITLLPLRSFARAWKVG